MLTPLGRGQAQLLTGLPGSGKTLAAVDAVLGQAASGVRCVYASVRQSAARQAAAVDALRDGGAMAYTTVVAAPEGAASLPASSPAAADRLPLIQTASPLEGAVQQ